MAAKLQCEICGGKLVGKPGGIFECENCGTEYSTEWAKAKIQEIKGTVKVEGTVEVSGKVQIDGPVKVENGGPSADSLVKRGMMEMEALWKKNSVEIKKREEIKGYFNRALEIDPEFGPAYWGLYLDSQYLGTTENAIKNGIYLDKLEDKDGYFDKALRFSKGELKHTIEQLKSDWERGVQDDLLPVEMRDSFFVRSGLLRRKRFSHVDFHEVTIPSGVTGIDDEAFSHCLSLKSLVIPEGVTKIGYSAFEGCLDLDFVIIPHTITEISNGMFSKCWRLTSITIPDSVTSIGGGAFDGCSALASITIPDGVTSIGAGAFRGCSALTSIMIPDGITSIGEFAFNSCSALASITIPDSVTSIGQFAFYGCAALTSITIPDGVTSIGQFAFYGCAALKSITIPDGVTSIGESAFCGCSALKSITIPDGVTSIGESAFYGCAALKSITIPDGVTSIGQFAFDGCSALTIRAKGGTKAQQYAENEHIPFDRIKTPEEMAADEAARILRVETLNQEKASLQTELSNLKGLFSGKRRREIEARLAAIEAELKKLG